MSDLTDRLRAFSRRYDPRAPERKLFLEAVAKIEEMEGTEGTEDPFTPAPTTTIAAVEGDTQITWQAVEAAMGGSKLFPWQKKKLPSAPE